MPLAVRRHRFRSMGTDVELIAGAAEDERTFVRAAERVERTFVREDRRCSRFREDSELSHVNRRAGQPTRLSPGLSTIVAHALEAAERTDGRFDPTVLDAVVAAGYDRDFDEVLAGARVALSPARPCGRSSEVTLDADLLLLPLGVGLDLGGIAKGWTVDVATAEALDEGLSWVVVNAGGDLRVDGDLPRTGIDVGVEDPQALGLELLTLRVDGGAIATSSTTRRAWGEGLHHLIDPSTGAPASTGIVQATVWAPTCGEAEVLAKDALLLGEDALDRMLGVLVTADGRVVMNLEDGQEEAA
ncbi:MAG TPA: FAD:protein FMN transferase [Actinomycetota bacterium]|nr:FAD:protein FMN transferase [Actinomycetota bacterium]